MILLILAGKTAPHRTVGAGSSLCNTGNIDTITCP
jgi:hypothetical protein